MYAEMKRHLSLKSGNEEVPKSGVSVNTLKSSERKKGGVQRRSQNNAHADILI